MYLLIALLIASACSNNLYAPPTPPKSNLSPAEQSRIKEMAEGKSKAHIVDLESFPIIQKERVSAITLRNDLNDLEIRHYPSYRSMFYHPGMSSSLSSADILKLIDMEGTTHFKHIAENDLKYAAALVEVLHRTDMYTQTRELF